VVFSYFSAMGPTTPGVAASSLFDVGKSLLELEHRLPEDRHSRGHSAFVDLRYRVPSSCASSMMF